MPHVVASLSSADCMASRLALRWLQVLLLVSAGTLTGMMPVMFLVYFLFIEGWMVSVKKLAASHTFVDHQSPMASVDE